MFGMCVYLIDMLKYIIKFESLPTFTEERNMIKKMKLYNLIVSNHVVVSWLKNKLNI